MQGDVLTRDDLYKRGPKVHAKMGLQMIFSGDFKSHSRSVHQKKLPLGRWQAGSPGSWLTEFFNVGMAFTRWSDASRAGTVPRLPGSEQLRAKALLELVLVGHWRWIAGECRTSSTASQAILSQTLPDAPRS